MRAVAAALDALSQAILVLRSDGAVVIANATAREELGIAAGDNLLDRCVERERLSDLLSMAARGTAPLPGGAAARVDGKLERIRLEAAGAAIEGERFVLVRLWPASREDRFGLLGQTLGELSVEVIRRQAIEAALDEETRQLASLFRLSNTLARATTPEDVLGAAVVEAFDLPATAVAVGWLADEEGALAKVAERWADGAPRASWETPPPPIALAAQSGRPAWLSDGELGIPEPPLRAVAALPLVHSGRSLGLLAVGFRGAEALGVRRRQLLHAFAEQCAQALDRARLYESERAARRAAEQAAQAARQADQRKDAFLAMLGHELRNPLAPIVTALDLMRLRASDEVLHRERGVIERQVRHLTRLVDDLLDISRVTSGKIELSRERIEISQVVATAIETVGPLLEQGSHRLSLEVPRIGLLVSADRVRLSQVIANLLHNAAKYTPPGGDIAVSAARVADRVVVQVRDNGVGIAPELLPGLFEMFTQGAQSIDRAQGGLGLGLCISKSLVELHGGTIEARSEGLGRGSEFIVSLPARDYVSAPSHPGTLRAVRVAERPLRVLVVDDNVDAASLLADALRALAHEIDVAHDGPSALALSERSRYDVVLLDLGLPVMDGFEVARRMRDTRGADELALIALTGYGQDGDRARARDAGFDDHLVKPVDLEHVAQTIDRLAQRRAAGR